MKRIRGYSFIMVLCVSVLLTGCQNKERTQDDLVTAMDAGNGNSDMTVENENMNDTLRDDDKKGNENAADDSLKADNFTEVVAKDKDTKEPNPKTVQDLYIQLLRKYENAIEEKWDYDRCETEMLCPVGEIDNITPDQLDIPTFSGLLMMVQRSWISSAPGTRAGLTMSIPGQEALKKEADALSQKRKKRSM